MGLWGSGIMCGYRTVPGLHSHGGCNPPNDLLVFNWYFLLLTGIPIFCLERTKKNY
ncbi:hypothetical protein L873DRAFT_1320735 [Choiromyces venosus 120613-1]|uniref:Uncharacterized protein n=1 Tax=Choiromyces venosus 120613-1 TaxID=1336337 RepID=A0A3N4JN23_9PEZI|nr:hypothetical protein L873DRAFT_1320735 [Choiromyces venosus 120613-1]